MMCGLMWAAIRNGQVKHVFIYIIDHIEAQFMINQYWTLNKETTAQPNAMILSNSANNNNIAFLFLLLHKLCKNRIVVLYKPIADWFIS